ncbi:MAG: MFS transporter, partial [Acidimicrobiales bacterium]
MALDGWLGVLGERNFRLYFIGRVTSFLGTGMVPVALAFAVLGQGRSTSDVGYVLGAETVPLVGFILIGGVVADRVSRRKLMLGSDVLRSLAQGGMAAWLLVGHPPLWGFLVLEAFVGLGTAFFTPAMTALIPEVASDARLQQANSLNNLAMSGGTLVGPALAGILVATVGPGWAIAADAGSYMVSAACLGALRVQWVGVGQAESPVSQLVAGWRVFWSRTWLWAIVVQFAFFHLLAYAPFLVLGAVIARDSLGGAAAWGAILAAQGAGSVVAGILMLRVRLRRPLLVAELTVVASALPLLALALGASAFVVGVAAFAGGAGLGIFGPLWDTTMQREIPSHLLSRVSAYDWFGSLVFLPVGYALAGPLAGAIGSHTVLYLGAAYMAASCAVLLAMPSVVGIVHRADPVA